MATKMLLDTLKTADDGRVECSVATPDGGVVQGVIEQSFFEEFVMAQPAAPKVAPAGGDKARVEAVKRAEAARQQRILRENIAFVEGEFDKQWRMGGRVFVLR